MDNDEIMKAIEQVAAQYEQNEKKTIIEAFIRDMTTSMRLDVQNALTLCNMNIPEPTRKEIDAWRALNGSRFSFKVAEVVAILLRKELLGE